jgi:hypothetical protein
MCYEQLRGELVQPQPTAGPICSKKDSFTLFFFPRYLKVPSGQIGSA